MFPPLARIIALTTRHALVTGISAAVVAGAVGTGVGFRMATSGAPGAPPSTTPPASIPTAPSAGGNPYASKGAGKGKKGTTTGGTLTLTQLITLVSQQTGQTTAQINAALATGQTLDQISGSKDQAVKDAANQTYRHRLDVAVGAGKLSQDQENTMLAAFATQLNKTMATPGQQLLAKGKHGGKKPSPAASPTPAASPSPAI